MTYSEIAATIGISQGTVKRYLQIAVESITQFLESQALPDTLKLILAITLFEYLK